MFFKRITLFFLLLTLFFNTKGQTEDTFMKYVEDLCSPQFHGRGYVLKGDSIAANYIATRFEELGLKSFDSSYYQHFNLPINTFPGTIALTVDDKELIPGHDFIPYPDCPTTTGTFDIIRYANFDLVSKRGKKGFMKCDLSKFVIALTQQELKEVENSSEIVQKKIFGCEGLIVLGKQAPLAVLSDCQNNLPMLYVEESAFPEKCHKVNLTIEAKLIPTYESQNVVAYIPGEEVADSFIVVSAHYDHIGQMNDNVIFYGANDNASGTSMIMCLAEHFSKAENRPACSMVFIAFGAEEAGLIGSHYYVEHPLAELNRTKFVLNLDLIGAGSKGATVVNGGIFNDQFEKLSLINEQEQLLPQIKKTRRSSQFRSLLLLQSRNSFIFHLFVRRSRRVS